jgi:hypothetical protein
VVHERDVAAVVEEARSRGRPTVPATVGLEKATNPFFAPEAKIFGERLVWRIATTSPLFPYAGVSKTRSRQL